MFVVAAHEAVLRRLGLTSVDRVRAYEGELVKNQRGRRDILRIRTTDEAGRPLTLYLKRTFRPYLKDGLWSLLSRGEVWSMSRKEWENLRALNQAGVPTVLPVAFGDECTALCERFSFIITQAAPASRTVADLLGEETDRVLRRRVLGAMAKVVRRMHDAGLASPDLFARHFFVDPAAGEPRFWLIDMARLDRQWPMGKAMRARDLASLNVSVPLRNATARERVAFLRAYDGQVDRDLVGLIRRRAGKLIRRSQHKVFDRNA